MKQEAKMRKTYGDIFSFDRLMNIYFYTSSIDKLLQAKAVFGRFGYEIRHYLSRREPYDEDYSEGTRALLTKAVAQVSSEFGLRSIFFVEDTSVRIEALSEEADFPGLFMKEWFSKTTFEELSRQLSLRGGNRAAVIKSDIALHIPTLSRPLFFQGSSAGRIAETPPDFTQNVQYPWLTPSTFNGWFIPEGAKKRLGEMEFEESLSFDFRVSSFMSLLDTVEALHAALNLPNQSYVRRMPSTATMPLLSILPDERPQLLIIIGHKCSGKTTMGDYLSMSQRVTVFEASTILRGLADEIGSRVTSGNEAMTFLTENGKNCVAERIALYVEKSTSGLSVVTGLRTVEEVLYLRRQFTSSLIVLIDVDAKTRFERHLRRARDADIKTFRDFLNLDEEQRSFGLMRVAAEISDKIIRNQGSLREFQRRIDDVVHAPAVPNLGGEAIDTELYRSLLSLSNFYRAATCDEISAGTHSGGGRPVRRYNTNRALKAVPEFAERIEKKRQPLRYRITSSGRALIDLVRGQ